MFLFLWPCLYDVTAPEPWLCVCCVLCSLCCLQGWSWQAISKLGAGPSCELVVTILNYLIKVSLSCLGRCFNGGDLFILLLQGWIKYPSNPLLDVILTFSLFRPLCFIKEWSTVVGPAGLPGLHALGLEGQEVVPALIPLLKTGDKTALAKPLRPLTVKTKICCT